MGDKFDILKQGNFYNKIQWTIVQFKDNSFIIAVPITYTNVEDLFKIHFSDIPYSSVKVVSEKMYYFTLENVDIYTIEQRLLLFR
jgi:hypothetical protein